jgi:hypothetical protein
MAAHSATGGGKRRSPWAVAGLNLITLGLYSVYWWYVANRELRDLGRSHNAPELEKEPALSALAFFLGSCLVIPLVWTAVTTAQRIRLAQDIVGTTRFLRVGIPVVLLVASVLVHFVGGESSAAFAVLMAATLAFKIAAVTYMQVSLNEIWELSSATAEPQPAATEDLDPRPLAQV